MKYMKYHSTKTLFEQGVNKHPENWGQGMEFTDFHLASLETR